MRLLISIALVVVLFYYLFKLIPQGRVQRIKIAIRSKGKIIWQKANYWQKSVIIGVISLAGLHLVLSPFIMENLISSEGLGGLAVFIVFEFPLAIFHLFLSRLFGHDFIPNSDFFFRLWILTEGTIAWGVLGGATGGIAAVIVGFFKKTSDKMR